MVDPETLEKERRRRDEKEEKKRALKEKITNKATQDDDGMFIDVKLSRELNTLNLWFIQLLSSSFISLLFNFCLKLFNFAMDFDEPKLT